MNFYRGGGEGDEHHSFQKNFTCSSCHTSIIDGIIIGKNDDSLFIDIELIIPSNVEYEAVQINIDGKTPTIAGIMPYLENEIGTVYNLDLSSTKGNKKENKINIKYPISENKEVIIQGVLTNIDGTTKGDYSFYKKISLEENSLSFDNVSIYPTIANSKITIKDAKLNSLFSIFDISGKVVYQNTILDNSNTIDVSNFNTGYYFISIENNEIIKFIVRK